jgi:hypothetical protein
LMICVCSLKTTCVSFVNSNKGEHYVSVFGMA